MGSPKGSIARVTDSCKSRSIVFVIKFCWHHSKVGPDFDIVLQVGQLLRSGWVGLFLLQFGQRWHASALPVASAGKRSFSWSGNRKSPMFPVAQRKVDVFWMVKTPYSQRSLNQYA